MLLTHVVLGAAAGAGGEGLSFIGRYWGPVLGPVLIVLGLVWVGWVRLPLPALPLRVRRASTLWGAFALGAPFSVAVCPICTPALAVLLGRCSRYRFGPNRCVAASRLRDRSSHPNRVRGVGDRLGGALSGPGNLGTGFTDLGTQFAYLVTPTPIVA
jgi:hypothetical protein